MDDKCLEAEVDYFLNPTDQGHYPTFEYNYNLVGSRPMFRQESPDLLDFGIDEPGSVVGPKGWLFHDLTDHTYGVDQSEVAPVGSLNAETANVDVVISHTVQFILTT